MRVGVPKETHPGERRVALVPESAGRLVEAGATVVVEAGAGEPAGFPDAAYREAGASVAEDAAEAWGADVVVKVRGPRAAADGAHEADRLREGALLVALFHPLAHPDLVRRLAERRVTALSMDLVPRITRAQRMDALSSQSTAAGYQAALVAADRLGRFFPMLMTAAGTVPPARVLVLGAGVAGLQAIATARRLGAVVQAFDIRPAAREQVESLGATFVGLTVEDAEDKSGYAKEVDEDVHRREQELLARLVAESDAVITTALVPGKPAPVLITGEMVAGMRPGSVVVDLAAEAGGNCELTEAGREAVHYGVAVIGLADAPSGVAFHASQMYARNVSALLQHLAGEAGVGAAEAGIELEDEIVGACCVTHAGEVVHAGARAAVGVGT